LTPAGVVVRGCQLELVTGLTGRYPLHDAVLGWELVPDADGHRVARGVRVRPERRLQRTGDRSGNVGSPDDVEAATHNQWLVHVAPLTPLEPSPPPASTATARPAWTTRWLAPATQGSVLGRHRRRRRD